MFSDLEYFCIPVRHYIYCAAITTYASIFNIFSTTTHFPQVNTKLIINRIRITTCKWLCLREALLHYSNRNISCIHIYFIPHILKLQIGILVWHYVAIFSNDVCAMVRCEEYANANAKLKFVYKL